MPSMFRRVVLLVLATSWTIRPVVAVDDDVCSLVQSQVSEAKKLRRETADDGVELSQLTKLMRLKQELSQLTGELDGILRMAHGSEVPSGREMARGQRLNSPLQQNIIINNSKIFGNVINGNNAAPIHSDFVGNSIRERRVSAGDTAWKHEVFMPIGNTRKLVDVSANGTDINHHVNTDLFDQNSHSIGEAASSRSFGRAAGLEDQEDGNSGNQNTLLRSRFVRGASEKNFTSLRKISTPPSTSRRKRKTHPS